MNYPLYGKSVSRVQNVVFMFMAEVLFAMFISACGTHREVPLTSSNPSPREQAPEIPQENPAPTSQSAERPTPIPKRGQMIPDCIGGEIELPEWVSFIPFSTGLCVTAPRDHIVRIDYGQNLISKSDYFNGTPDKQVYYSVSQVEIPAGETKIVWGFCGGSGSPLEAGTRVLPGPRVTHETSNRVGQLVTLVKQTTEEIKENIEAAQATGNKEFQRRAEKRMQKIRNIVRLLREALINTFRESLTSI